MSNPVIENIPLAQTYFLDFLLSAAGNENPALYINERYFSYHELGERVVYAAARIAEANIRGQHIAVYLNDEVDTYAAILAVWYSGNIFIPIHASYPLGRISQIHEKASFRGIFNATENVSSHLGPQVAVWNFPESIPAEDRVPEMHRYQPDEICYCLFTSGSTGVPKGVQISYRNLSSFLESAVHLDIRPEPGAGYLQMFEHTFDLSVVSTLWPLMNRGTLYHVGNAGAKYTEIYRLLEEFQIAFAIIVPSVLNMLKPYFDEISLPGLKFLALSGEAVPADFESISKKCWPNARVFNFYGPTECTIFCTAYEMPADGCLQANGIMSIGKPVHHAQSLLSDENGNFSKSSSKGLLWIGGNQVMPGYLGQDSLTAERIKFLDGIPYYNTGDLVQRDDQGFLYYLGRIDQQVKINGYRIELSEIEYHAAQVLSRPCVALATKDSKGDQLILFVNDSQESQPQDIKERLGSRLPAYMIPEKIFFSDPFPLNANGKLDRNALRQQYEMHHP